MSTYAQRIDVENYIEGWVTVDPVALEREIRRAEQDLEPFLFPLNVDSPPSQVISLMQPQGGTFKVLWNGTHPAQTPSESYAASPAQLQTDLQTLTDIGSGNVTVVGQPPVWTLVWTKTWAQGYSDYRVPVVGVDTSGLLPGGTTGGVVPVRGRRINPLVDLNADQAIALASGVCAQVEYRLEMGPRFFTRSEYASVRGPDFTTQGKLPKISPKARRELSGSGLLLKGGRAVAGFRRVGVGKGWPTY